MRTIAIVCGRHSASSTTVRDVDFDARRISMTASATAVDSSSIEAFAVSRPVRSETIVWKLSSASSLPCEISGWYGVYAV